MIRGERVAAILAAGGAGARAGLAKQWLVLGGETVLRRSARLLAACPDVSVRDGSRALDLALAVWNARPLAAYAETVALALAELDRCSEAAEWQRKSVEAARQQGLEKNLTRALSIYEKGSPCRP